jgi:hypothetical protein
VRNQLTDVGRGGSILGVPKNRWIYEGVIGGHANFFFKFENYKSANSWAQSAIENSKIS